MEGENESERARSETRGPKGWHRRGYLPHLDDPGKTQSVTFRLADSMPQHVLDTWEQELKELPPEKIPRERLRKIEAFLDSGYGSCALRQPEIAQVVQDSLLFFDGGRYHLEAWVIMPNHVHVLMKPMEGEPLGLIVASWKRFTANEINRILKRKGQFWFDDYFDRYMRNEEHYSNEVAYIERNPVVAGLCDEVDEWPFGSARFK